MSVRSLLLFVGAISLALPAGAAVERTVEKTFPVSPGSTLKIDTAQGVVRVTTADQNEIQILVRQTFPVNDQAQADESMRSLDLQIDQSGETVTITARYRSTLRWAWQNWPPVGLSYEVRVPRSCNLDVNTREGDITVGQLQGTVNVRTGAGTVFVGETDGVVTASSWRGDVSVTACSGALTLSARAGNILVGRAGGTTKVEGTGGLIEIQNARGSVEARGNNADIKISFANPLVGNSELTTSGGEVTANFDKGSAFWVMARASLFGTVRVQELPLSIMAGAADSSKLEGKLNGGGPIVRVSASGGIVRLSGYDPTL